MISSTCARCSSVSSSISSSWANPRMAFMGVRSSWLTRDRNRLLAWLPASAASRARSSCSDLSWRSCTDCRAVRIACARRDRTRSDVRAVNDM